MVGVFCFSSVYRVDFPTTATAGTKLLGKLLKNNEPFRVQNKTTKRQNQHISYYFFL